MAPRADSPGVAPVDVPIPTEDLKGASLALARDPDGSGAITIRTKDYADAGRIFKWLLGQWQLAWKERA